MAPDDYTMDTMHPMDNERSVFPAYMPVGMTYTPMQRIRTVYEPENALERGTYFPDLDKPWLDGRSYQK